MHNYTTGSGLHDPASQLRLKPIVTWDSAFNTALRAAFCAVADTKTGRLRSRWKSGMLGTVRISAHRQKRTVRRHHEPAGRPSLDHRPEATPAHHRRLGACRAVTAPRITRSVRSSRRARSCLTRADHRPVVWPHEIPDSGISHRRTGSSPRSGTEAGDISPVFAALEHAAGDFTTLGKNPLLEGSSPPSDTQTGEISRKTDTA